MLQTGPYCALLINTLYLANSLTIPLPGISFKFTIALLSLLFNFHVYMYT